MTDNKLFVKPPDMDTERPPTHRHSHTGPLPSVLLSDGVLCQGRLGTMEEDEEEELTGGGG